MRYTEYKQKCHRCICFVFGNFFNTDGDKYKTVHEQVVDNKNKLFTKCNFKLVIRGSHNLYTVIEMFQRLTIESITFDEYKLHLPYDDMVLYRNVMQVNIYIKKYEDSEYKEEFPRNLRFMSAIQSLTIN